MQRRDFLAGSATAVAAAATGGSAHAIVIEEEQGARELYEWRTYRLSDAAKQARIHEYLEAAALPTWKRLGVGPVGAFTEIGADAGPSIHVLLTYPSAELVATAREALEQDAAYQKAAAGYLAAKRDAPAFDRIDSSLMLAMSAAPKLTPPAAKPRVLELRTYENHGEDRARAKVSMFNDGEMNIFPKCGFENVFFSETLVGANLPNMKYMLAAPDMAANAAGWKTFITHPDFVRMKNDPKYADTEPKITKLFLEPTAYSQV